MTPLERVIAIRTGGGTERAHGIRHHGSYSVASHTWGVLTLVYVLWGPEFFARVAAAVTFHDVPEAWVGDIPAPTKRYNMSVKLAVDQMDQAVLKRLDLLTPYVGLSLEDKARIKAADMLELYLWAAEEVAGGNRHAACLMRELIRYFGEQRMPDEFYPIWTELATGGSVEHASDGLIYEINKKAE